MTPENERGMSRPFEELKFMILRKTVKAAEAAKLLLATAYARPFRNVFSAVRTEISLPETDQVLCLRLTHTVLLRLRITFEQFPQTESGRPAPRSLSFSLAMDRLSARQSFRVYRGHCPARKPRGGAERSWSHPIALARTGHLNASDYLASQPT